MQGGNKLTLQDSVYRSSQEFVLMSGRDKKIRE